MSDQGHRGGFGDFGGESSGLIERSFRERIVLVGVELDGASGSGSGAGAGGEAGDGDGGEPVERSLDELALLVDTAGADVVERVVQSRAAPDPATYIGKGKVAELAELCEAVDADTVVFDDELSPGQQFNLEKALGRTAIDRTAVILDIFAQNAHSQEGKAQVELAQLRYRLPRLKGRGKGLSQQAGGIGRRGGPGETQLEMDRRRIERRLHKLEADLRSVSKVRRTQAAARRRSGIPTVAIVGYTNAGKSTLLNRLTDAGVVVEDRLFATLDAATRRLALPGGQAVLITDTVGFITKLPHQLVEAFKSTLEVVTDADLLVHVVDASGPDPMAAMAAVDTVLTEIGAGSIPQLHVLNKADVDPEGAQRLAASLLSPSASAVGLRGVVVSARTGEGIDELLRSVADRLHAMSEVSELVVPFDRGDVLAALHRDGEVLAESPGTDGMEVKARLDSRSANRWRDFMVS